MHRFLVSQLRFRRGRVTALGLGILVAAVSFTMLTSAAATSELRVKRTVEENFITAYDILVRPRDSFTPLERDKGLVSANYLSGIFGGISFRQYREIRDIPGVEVAAPIANVGYILPVGKVDVGINAYLTDADAQMYRLTFTWLAQNHTSEYPDSDKYVYFTRRNPMTKKNPYALPEEVVGSESLPVCQTFYVSHPDPSGPFALAGFESLTCFSEKSPRLSPFGQGPTVGLPSPGWVGTRSESYFPILVGAVDPLEEDRLVGLEETLVSGRMLRSTDRMRLRRGAGRSLWRVVPVLASSRTYIDESIHLEIEQLSVPGPGRLIERLTAKKDAFGFVMGLTGTVVASKTIEVDTLYESLLETMTAPKFDLPYTAYWTTSPVGYRDIGDGRFAPLVVENPPSLFVSPAGGGWAPQENRDLQFRKLTQVQGSASFLSTGEFARPALSVVGRFDPEKLPGFSDLAAVPLETYYPPLVEPANASTARELGGKPLLPTQNLGDYITQPPLMLTTLKGLKTLTDPIRFPDADPEAPIGVVRVRVADVTGPDPVSRERIRRVAQLIHERTGLAIDITAGSSPHPLRVDLPAGMFGRPPLEVEEGWVQKGAAVTFLRAIDKKSLALFGLILLICVFFLANGVLAAVRTRRAEIGTLMCLGWSRTKIFAAILGEVTLVGVIAGLVGSALAALLVTVFSFEMSLMRVLVVIPVALGLAVISAFFPAWRASGSTPLDAVRPSVSDARRGIRCRHLVTMALMNLRRVPGRTLLGAAGLFIGVGALTVLIAINLAFQGVLVDTVMGQFISLQIRGVDVFTIALTITLGGLAVADVLYLNVKERAAEFVTLRTVGWYDRDTVTLVAAEGVAMGAIGSLAGALAGASISSLFHGVSLLSIALGASISAAAGIVSAALASLLPLSHLRRLTPPSVLAEEW